jgi:hypothetical protein
MRRELAIQKHHKDQHEKKQNGSKEKHIGSPKEISPFPRSE